jgi:quinoprotein glucose dehydrogenase
VDALSPGAMPDTGTMNFGGATTTAGGLVFVAASTDAKFRAYDSATGKVVFETQLEAAGYGAPVTYQGKDGHQYVVLFAGGGGKAKTKSGDYVVAYRLKQ